MVRLRLLSVLVAALAALPLSGCLEGGPGPAGLAMASGLFDFTPIERGEPGAVPVEDCASLEQTLRSRALDQARIALDQGVREEYWGGGWFRGEAQLFAMEDSAAAPASGGSGTASASGAQVTGTNNQEQAADEADLVKTDGEWTYVLSAGVLHILRSRTVGSLERVTTVPFGHAWGGELLLERRDPADPADDRLLLILPGQTPPEDQPLAQQAVSGKTSGSASLGIGYWGGGMTRIVVLSLADRSAPRVEHEAWVDDTPSGTRLVDGAAHVVIQTWE
jgi:hypothetical protein